MFRCQRGIVIDTPEQLDSTCRLEPVAILGRNVMVQALLAVFEVKTAHSE